MLYKLELKRSAFTKTLSYCNTSGRLRERGSYGNTKCSHRNTQLLTYERADVVLAMGITGSEIALSWSPMQLIILHWRPEFHNRSPHFSIWRLKKIPVAIWCLYKKVNFGPWYYHNTICYAQSKCSKSLLQSKLGEPKTHQCRSLSPPAAVV